MATRRLAAFFGTFGVLAVAGVMAVTAYAVFMGPDRALAAMESLPFGAIGLTATAPADAPARGAEMIPTSTADASAQTLRPKAVKKAKAPIPWKHAVCSTYGIGDGLLGSGLAGGGRLDSDSLVVAHKSLPFGTKISFSYHGRTCTAVVRDRGPYVAGRTFDLGPGVAERLGFGGVGSVKYLVVND